MKGGKKMEVKEGRSEEVLFFCIGVFHPLVMLVAVGGLAASVLSRSFQNSERWKRTGKAEIQ